LVEPPPDGVVGFTVGVGVLGFLKKKNQTATAANARIINAVIITFIFTQ